VSNPQKVERFCPACERSWPEGTATCPEDGTRLVVLAPKKDPLIGRDIEGRFTIRERLGAGGMGAVYRALQASVGREVAIKVIEARWSTDLTAAKRFLREARLASRLAQPNTVSVLDFGQTEDGMLYLAMELIEGRTLARVLEQEGRFSAERMVRVATQLCDALEAAHALSIAHRDLKPSNVIVLDDPPGRDLVKVLDFGLAKSLAGDASHTTVTQSDAVVGTPAYLAPEVIEGKADDTRSDLYSLGVILYELLAGNPPFLADSIQALYMMHLEERPPPLPDDVPPVVAAAVMRLLEKDPGERFPTAAATREALRAAVEDPLRRTPPTLPSRRPAVTTNTGPSAGDGERR
jgi:eukaryotic-like serine/threonine-protein kinase